MAIWKRNFIGKTIASFVALFLCCASGAFAALDLTGYTTVERRAETAAAAKSAALSEARRELFNTVLSRYADAHVISQMSEELSGGEIENLISSTSIENEKTSSTAYSATIRMTFNREAVEKWMTVNNVPNFMAAADNAGDRVIVFAEFDNGLADWIPFIMGLRDADMWSDLDLSTRTVFGPQVTMSISANSRRAFTNTVAGMGWTVSDRDGILRIAKK